MNILSHKIKLSTSANSFKHAIKEDFFAQLQKNENDPFVYPQNYRGVGSYHLNVRGHTGITRI